MDTIILEYQLPGGVTGSDDDSYNPLARAVADLFKSGQRKSGRPFHALTHCYCADPIKTTTSNHKFLRWFGVFLHSARGRVIFYPGFNSPQTQVQTYRDNSLIENRPFGFDHITLENDFRKWHMTSTDSASHMNERSTLNLGEGRFLWFGLSISNINILRIVYEQIKIAAPIPATDVKRRAEIFNKAAANRTHQILEFHPEAIQSISLGFIHFSVIVGPRNFELYNGTEIGIPEGPPILDPLPRKQVTLPIWKCQFNLSEDIDIQITTTAFTGQLKTPIVITSKAEPTP